MLFEPVRSQTEPDFSAEPAPAVPTQAVPTPCEAAPSEPLRLIGLDGLVGATSGAPEVAIGLIDGPVALTHPDLVTSGIRELPGAVAASCGKPDSAACTHGTFIAGVLHARRGFLAPAICPGCTLLVRAIFAEAPAARSATGLPDAAPQNLAAAIVDVVDAGARVINLSVALTEPSSAGDRALEQALDHAARRGAIVVAAAGNQGMVGSSPITRHRWVIPVVACDPRGAVTGLSNLGMSIGRYGVGAPGRDVVSLCASGGTMRLSGTSIAVPFVTGAIALLWSLFPDRGATEIKLAVTQGAGGRRRSVAPPRLDAAAAYRVLAAGCQAGRQVA